MLQKICFVFRRNLSPILSPLFHLNYKRKKLRNHNLTLLTQNCVGGIIYHDLGLQFRSPTINLYMTAPDFVTFLEQPERYLELPLSFINSTCPYPVGMLGELKIYFVHYESAEEAVEKWENRKKRINWDNLFIIMTDRDGCDETVVRRFEALPYKNRVLSSSKEYRDAPHCITLRRYSGEMSVGNINEYVSIFGKRAFEKGLDYVSWFNSEVG